MKLQNSLGLRFPLSGEAAAALDTAKAEIEAASKKTTVEVETVQVSTAAIAEEDKELVRQLNDNPIPEIKIPAMAASAKVEMPSSSATPEQKKSISKIATSTMISIFTMLLVKPLSWLLALATSPITAIIKMEKEAFARRPMAHTIAISVLILGGAALFFASATAGSIHTMRVHGALENAGVFSRIGFDMDNNKTTIIRASGFGSGRSLEVSSMVDGKGRQYTPTANGGWWRK